jgi:CheY-like chemotaxis protein
MTASSPAGRPWILIADDDPVLRALWVAVLGGAGYRTVEATTGREAVELMRTIVPNLVILDLRMPELTGQEVLAYVRSLPVVQEIPVLVVSGHLEETGSSGFNVVDRLAKPLDASRFLQAVERALASARQPPRPDLLPPAAP